MRKCLIQVLKFFMVPILEENKVARIACKLIKVATNTDIAKARLIAPSWLRRTKARVASNMRSVRIDCKTTITRIVA